MNCAICGKDNQAGTRFCVHCGAALTIPPPGASQQSTIATAGAVLGPKQPPSSSAAPSVSAPATATVPLYTPRSANAMPPADTRSIPPNVQSSPAVPAYDADPKKAGMVVVVIGVVGLLAVVGYLGYKFFGGPSDMKDTLTRIESAPSSQSASAPAPAGSSATPQAVTAAAPKPAEGKSAPPAADEPRPSAARAEEPKAPSSPPPQSESKAATKGSASTQGRPSVAPAVTPPSASAAAPQVAAHPVAPARSVAAAPSPVVDRWAQFTEELHRCQSEGFLSRVVCDQRVRIRFCDGYWGKVPQCPGGIVNPDRGQ